MKKLRSLGSGKPVMKTQIKNQPRTAEVHRKTKETSVRVVLNLDGNGQSQVSTGLPFLDHMLDLFARHGLFDLEIVCQGDLEIDDHHSVEDIAITLGQALTQALGDKAGIARYGEAVVPMDEALCRSVIDLSGRFYLVYEVQTRRQKIGVIYALLAREQTDGGAASSRSERDTREIGPQVFDRIRRDDLEPADARKILVLHGRLSDAPPFVGVVQE